MIGWKTESEKIKLNGRRSPGERNDDQMACSKSQLEKAMATDSSTLAWKIPWMEEPGRFQSMGSLRVGHD